MVKLYLAGASLLATNDPGPGLDPNTDGTIKSFFFLLLPCLLSAVYEVNYSCGTSDSGHFQVHVEKASSIFLTQELISS